MALNQRFFDSHKRERMYFRRYATRAELALHHKGVRALFEQCIIKGSDPFIARIC